MSAEALAKAQKDTSIRHRLECLAKAISACHKCDLKSAQVRQLTCTLYVVRTEDTSFKANPAC